MFEQPLVKARAQTGHAARSSLVPGNQIEHLSGTGEHAFPNSRSSTLNATRLPLMLLDTTARPMQSAANAGPANPRIQTKLRVSTPDDAEEKEAEEASDKLTGDSVSFFAGSGGPVSPDRGAASPSRQDLGAGWWEEVHRSALGKDRPQPQDALQGRLQARLGRGAALPGQVRSRMESSFATSFANVRVHDDTHAANLSAELRAHAFTYGRDIFFGAGQFEPASARGERLLAHELTHVVQQQRNPGERVHRQPAQPKQVTTIVNVTVGEVITGEEFKVRAVMQFMQVDRAEAQRQIAQGAWTAHGKILVTGITTTLVNKPIRVTFHSPGMSGAEKAAAGKRTAAVNALPIDQRKEVNDEVDRRFWQRFQYKPGAPLGKGQSEEGMREAWLRTREGVLGDQESVAKLTPKILDFLSDNGKRRIKPDEYKTALRIAKKLEGFTKEDWELYQRRVRASTEDYELLERSLDGFKAQQASEKNVRDRIAGKESLYQQVKSFESLQRRMMVAHPQTDTVEMDRPGNLERYTAAQSALDAALHAAGFADVSAFKAANEAFLDLFRKRGLELTLLVLQASERTVATERKRYEDPKVVEQLFAELAPLRAAISEADEAGRKSMPTPMQLKSDSLNSTPAQQAALAQSIEAGKRADALRKDASAKHPMLKDPKLSSYSLGTETPAKLGEALRRNADDRHESIVKTRIALTEEPKKIFKLDQIVALTRQELQVTPNSIYSMVIEDHQGEVSISDVLKGLAIGALALGLGVVSFGTGTVAVLAGAGALSIGVLGAAGEYDKYEEGQAAAHTDFDTALSVSSEEPSAVWLAIALIGIGLDGLPLAKAFKAALPAAKLLEEAGGAARFEAKLAEATELTEGMRKAINRAKDTQAKYLEAIEELAEAKRTAGGRLLALGDSEKINARIKIAYYAIKNKINDFDVFMRELKLGKLAKSVDVASMTAEDLKAWASAFKIAEEQVAADAAKFSVKVAFKKAGEKLVTFDNSGKMLLDGKAVTREEYKNIYKTLDLQHVIDGHGPQKPLIEVMNEAANAKTVAGKVVGGLAGRFRTDEVLLQSVERARAAWKIKPETEIFLDALPNDGRSFANVGTVPKGAQTMLPFDAPPGVVEVQVKRILAVFRPDGSLVSIYPVGF